MPGVGRWIAMVLVLSAATGCTRHFFRKSADTEAQQVLSEKDLVPDWKIEQFHVYPDPRARFADPTNPDRPPMPPDDPASYRMSPKSQRPGKAGVARVEGKGYLALMDAWDQHNRSMRPVTGDLDEESSIADRLGFGRPKVSAAVAEPVPTRPTGPDGRATPYLLTLDQAVELGTINSREFQNRREDLYLLALPVTFERFGFAAQFFALESTVRERTGSESVLGKGDRWRGTGAAGFTKLFSTGALLLVQYANTTVINLSNARNASNVTSLSTLNLDIVQPLLQGGGKAVTLEPLTQAERNLLYQIRDYARFRKVYFQYITGGSDVIASILTPGATLGVSLTPGAIDLGTANGANPQLRPSNAARLLLNNVGIAATSSGYLPTLLNRARADIERQNYDRLSGLVGLFRAYEGGGRVSSLQVGQVELQILQSKSQIATKDQVYRDSLDAFKFQLGLPINTPIELDDELLRPVFRQFTRFETTIEQFNTILKELENMDAQDEPNAVRTKLGKLLTDAPFVRATKSFRVQFPERWKTWQRDVLDDKSLVERLGRLRDERNKILDDKLNKEVAGEKVDPTANERLKGLDREVPTGELEYALRRFEQAPWRNLQGPAKNDVYLARFRDVRIWFAEVLGEASNERLDLLRPQWPNPPAMIVDDVDLIYGNLEQGYDVVTKVALENRLDLMNARAQVVDVWRQIAVQANALLGAFNVGYHLDSSTPPNEARPLAFAGSRTRHQLFLNFELPLVRVAERNTYRATLIAYQRARRALMSREDDVVAQVRAELRALQVLAQNYKIQQQAVELAYLQVESSLETFQAPVQPGAGGDNAAAAAALTTQLLNAYARLPNEQDRLVNIWLSYQIARQQLYLDLELLPLDARGVWIDEFNRVAEDLPGLRLDPNLGGGVGGPQLGLPVGVPGVLP